MSWKETDTPFKLFLAFYTKIGICKVCPLRAFTRVFFFLLSQTGFVWLPCVCVIFFQSGIAVIVWDFPEWRRLGFTEIATLTLRDHLSLVGGGGYVYEFKFLPFCLCNHWTSREFLIFSYLFNRSIWMESTDYYVEAIYRIPGDILIFKNGSELTLPAEITIWLVMILSNR